MPLYRVKFHRLNFDFKPPLEQTADVLFEADLDLTVDATCYSAGAAWDAMWVQNPHWKEGTGPHDKFSGWSSVMPDGEVTEVSKPLDDDLGVPGEGVPRIGELFTVKDRGDSTYRIGGFYKEFISKRKKKTLTDELLAEIIAEENADLTPAQIARKANRMKVIQCTREEAQFVSGSGVGGTIARIEDLEIFGLVGWEKHTILKYRKDYKIFDDGWPTEIYKYWEDEKIFKPES